MKNLTDIIKEALIKKDTKIRHYEYFPKNKDELRSLLEQLLDERGKDADLNDINTSAITNMFNLFYNLDPHNIHIEKWDVSNVKYMRSMFFYCHNFNCDLSQWDVSNVKSMRFMFAGCKNFNSDLTEWNVHKVEDMACMFERSEFNQDISKWDVSGVTTMNRMFYHS